MVCRGISTASEAGTKDIQNVANIIINNNVPTIFIESSVPIRQIKALKAAVNAKGWTVEIGEELYTDAMGDFGTIEGTYIGMMKHNVNSIVTGLKKMTTDPTNIALSIKDLTVAFDKKPVLWTLIWTYPKAL